MPGSDVILGAASALLYTGTVSATAITAIGSRSPERRRSARKVLALLLFRSESRGNAKP
jgi:hypothetical protein